MECFVNDETVNAPTVDQFLTHIILYVVNYLFTYLYLRTYVCTLTS